MFASNSAHTVEEYLDSVPAERKDAVNFLHEFIQKSAPDLAPHFAYNMLGYGTFHYIDRKTKQPKPWPIVALANQKNYISLYVCACKDGQYLAEKYTADLGKVSVGRSCIRIKKINDIHLPTLQMLLQEAQTSGGMVGAETVG
ncbi:DUF1801 domain-containing protein [Candidatus Saccharibacteria bacterium]|nr:DUF1801 domain-containing protein [Candidatus Saccharibacteria bacterium]